jgi:phenylalanine-4-hydroxylase
MSLTTTEAPFIESARSRGELYIHQPHELYSDENHTSWNRLVERITPRWEKYANLWFLEGIQKLDIKKQGVPKLEDINKFLEPLTGFKAKPVSGYVPAFLFFDCLRRREFPTTITIRRSDKLDYLPEPDIFHDVAGHVPMHTSKRFADVLVRFGECANKAVEFVSTEKNKELKEKKLQSIICAMARFFWFTIEFGLMKKNHSEICAYGSGILSSYGELEYSIISPEVQRYPIQLEWVINQSFEIHHYQPLLFVVDSFDHLFSLVDQLEKWLLDDKLSNIAPGEPEVSREDLESFLNAK